MTTTTRLTTPVLPNRQGGGARGWAGDYHPKGPELALVTLPVHRQWALAVRYANCYPRGRRRYGQVVPGHGAEACEVALHHRRLPPWGST